MKFRFFDTMIAVNVPDRAELLVAVRARMAAGAGFALATINLDHLVKLGRSARFRAAYGAQDLVVADGNPIVWLSRLAGRPVKLVPGSDLVLPLCELAAEGGWPVVFVGSTAPALAEARAVLEARVPGLVVAQTIAPAMGFDPAGEAAGEILRGLTGLGPCLCFLALGAPKQEELAARGRVLAPQVGFASVGAGLDFVAGRQNRAPAWVRAIAMEWAWRAFSAPRRLIPRYAACAAILPGQVVQAWRQRGRPEA